MDQHDAPTPTLSRIKSPVSVPSRSASQKQVSQPSQPGQAANDGDEELHTYTLCLLGYLQHMSSPTTGAIQEIPLQLDSAIRQVSCGLDWIWILTERGRAYSFGSNTYGQLAQSHTRAVVHPTPVLFSMEKRIMRVSCGSSHGGFLLDCGSLFMFGCGSYGRLGTGNDTSQSTPVAVKMQWSELYANTFAVGLEPRSTIPGFNAVRCPSQPPIGPTTRGESLSAQGDDHDDVRFVDISCGDRHTLLLGAQSVAGGSKATKSHIIAFGDGMNGRLGLGSERDQLRGALLAQFQTSVVGALPQFASIHSGAAHNVAVTSEGELFTWGNGADGQLGHGGTESEWTPREVQFFRGNSIASARCGAKHTIAVSRSGVVYSWGCGREGQLGSGTLVGSATQPQRIKLVVDPTAAQQAQIEGQLAAGASFSSQASAPSLLAMQDTRVYVRHIATRANATMALDEQSRLFVWGDNAVGQLGVQTVTEGGTTVSSAPLPIATPRQLVYMVLREPKRLSSRVRGRVLASAVSSLLPRVALTHFEASEQFSLLVFRTKKPPANVLGHGGSVDDQAAQQADVEPTSMSQLTHRIVRQQSSLASGLADTTRWQFPLVGPLQTSDMPSHEAAFYNYMTQYKVCIRSKTRLQDDDAKENNGNDGGKPSGSGRPASNECLSQLRSISTSTIPNKVRNQLRACVKDNEGRGTRSPRGPRCANEAVKGFNAWLERHSNQLSPTSSPGRQARNQFGSSHRISSTHRGDEKLLQATNQTAFKEDDVRATAAPLVLSLRCKPRSPNSAVGRSIQSLRRASTSSRANGPLPSRPTTAAPTRSSQSTSAVLGP